ncbi:hypothetical protein GLOIN_2v1573991 [Rhizophagus irregularis DAOM 181602=DAOM 197198]|nr:hypothetical protein GLOIN_2v1573991 [Rhizophagus irregularis DAOM 181602=DAOM 197198]
MIEFSIDCFNDIVEFLEDDSNTFYSSCLPNNSKEILYNNGISISISKTTPLFNYASFCKYLVVYKIIDNVKDFLQNRVITGNFQITYVSNFFLRELTFAFTFIKLTSINIISWSNRLFKEYLNIIYLFKY